MAAPLLEYPAQVNADTTFVDRHVDSALRELVVRREQRAPCLFLLRR